MAKLLDTTALIDILQGKPELKKVLNLENDALFTTDINVFELFVGIHALKHSVHERVVAAEQLLARLHILGLDTVSARRAACMQGMLYQKGMPITDADCLIAAIAIQQNISTIMTRNKEHFGRIPGITVETY